MNSDGAVCRPTSRPTERGRTSTIVCATTGDCHDETLPRLVKDPGGQASRHRAKIPRIPKKPAVELGNNSLKAMSGLIKGSEAHFRGADQPSARDLMMVTHAGGSTLRSQHTRSRADRRSVGPQEDTDLLGEALAEEQETETADSLFSRESIVREGSRVEASRMLSPQSGTMVQNRGMGIRRVPGGKESAGILRPEKTQHHDHDARRHIKLHFLGAPSIVILHERRVPISGGGGYGADARREIVNPTAPSRENEYSTRVCFRASPSWQGGRGPSARRYRNRLDSSGRYAIPSA